MSADTLGVPPWFFYLAVGLLGLVIGSFLNVVIARLPRMLEAQWRAGAMETMGEVSHAETSPAARFDLAQPRSRCPSCQMPIRPAHNVPLIGYLWLRGRCASCQAKISLQYPLVEGAAAALALIVAARFGMQPFTGFALILTWALLALAVIDWREQLLPDAITLPLMWLGLLISLGTATSLVGPTTAILGAAAGYGVLWLVFHAFLLITGKEGMGFGDFKLLAALGAWLGWQQLPLVLLMASVAGAVAGGILMLSGHMARGRPMPFGPWLAIAGWLALVAGDTIIHAYLTLSGLR